DSKERAGGRRDEEVAAAVEGACRGEEGRQKKSVSCACPSHPCCYDSLLPPSAVTAIPSRHLINERQGEGGKEL
ncbi:unnamed protein product, partial [Musa textilis]